MAKRKSKPSTEYSFGVPLPTRFQDRRGRAAKIPDNLQAMLADFDSLTLKWIHRFDEVWFPNDSRQMLETADGAGRYEDSPELYEYAIIRMTELTGRAQEGLEQLKKGKSAAKKCLAGKKNIKKQKLVEEPQKEQKQGYGEYFE